MISSFVYLGRSILARRMEHFSSSRCVSSCSSRSFVEEVRIRDISSSKIPNRDLRFRCDLDLLLPEKFKEAHDYPR